MKPLDVKKEHIHHDTHALPPQFIQDAYYHYNKIKLADLDADHDVIDFQRGLSHIQQTLLEPVGVIRQSSIEAACDEFQKTICGGMQDFHPLELCVQDVTVYEHKNFPGLQIIPAILPPEIQVMFVSQIMHEHLADPKHKNNLRDDFEIDYPSGISMERKNDSVNPSFPGPVYSSFFTYAPTDSHAKPRDPIKYKPMNMVQMLSKKLRWLTIGDQYDWPTRSYSRERSTTFPAHLGRLVTGLFPHIKPESGVCLLYGGKDYMPVHRDVSEQCQTGLASFSFGCDGIFVVANGEDETEDPEEKKRRTVAIRVRSGDCLHMTGQSRWAWHAMPRTIVGTCPTWLKDWPLVEGLDPSQRQVMAKWKGYMASKRLNVSCRQVWI